MAKAKTNGSGAEMKVIKAKEALEDAKTVLWNARIDFKEAKSEFAKSERARIKAVISRLAK